MRTEQEVLDDIEHAEMILSGSAEAMTVAELERELREIRAANPALEF